MILQPKRITCQKKLCFSINLKCFSHSINALWMTRKWNAINLFVGTILNNNILWQTLEIIVFRIEWRSAKWQCVEWHDRKIVALMRLTNDSFFFLFLFLSFSIFISCCRLCGDNSWLSEILGTWRPFARRSQFTSIKCVAGRWCRISVSSWTSQIKFSYSRQC